MASTPAAGSPDEDVIAALAALPEDQRTVVVLRHLLELSPSEIADELQRTLMGWRYAPYNNASGQPSAACFAVSLRVVFKH